MMLGTVSNSLTKGVTHVVTNNILTDKVIRAYESNIPVMKIEWIDAVWKSSQLSNDLEMDEKYVEFSCPIFYNLNICLSQIPADLKSALNEVIVSNGNSVCFFCIKNNYSKPFSFLRRVMRYKPAKKSHVPLSRSKCWG
jgi:hypothetical protein